MLRSAEGVENPKQRRAAIFRDELHEVRRARGHDAITVCGIQARGERTLPFAHRIASRVPDDAFARALADEQPALWIRSDCGGARQPRIRDSVNDMEIAIERDEPAVWCIGGPGEAADARRRRSTEEQERVPVIGCVRTGA